MWRQQHVSSLPFIPPMGDPRQECRHALPDRNPEIWAACKFIGSFRSLDNPWLCWFLHPSPPPWPFPHKTLTLNPSGYAEEPVLAGEVEPRSWRIRAILPRSPRDWSHFWAKAVQERPPPRCLPPRFIPSLPSSRSHLLRSLTYIRFSVDLVVKWIHWLSTL